MKKYLKKIENRELKSSDIDLLIKEIEIIINEKREGYQELSDDDVKQLRVIRFLLKNYEENKENISFIANNEGLSYYKVRDLINNLNFNGIITFVISSMGGQFYFKINDKIRFRNYLYKLTEEILNKTSKEKSIYERIKRINWRKHIVKIIVGVLILVIGTVIATLIIKYITKEPTKMEFDFVSFNPTSFSCDNEDNFNITYKVAHINGEPVGFGQPYYLFVNQTKNTCLDNFTFFNTSKIKNLLCYNTFYEGGEVIGEACNPELEPLNQRTITIVSDQGELVNRMKENFRENNISNCEIEEQIKLCISSDKKGYCDDKITEAKINYYCLKSNPTF